MPQTASSGDEAGDDLGRARRLALVGSLPAVVAVVDETFALRFVNAAAARLTGGAPSDLVGSPVTELVHPDDRVEAAAALATALGGGRCSGRVRLGGGRRVVVVECSGVGIVWAGRPAALVVALDVTARAAAESAQDVVARATALFAGASVGYLEVGLDHVIRSHNPFVARLLRTDRLIGRRLPELVVPADRADLAAALAHTSADEPGVELSVRLRTPDGPAVRCLVSMAVVQDVTGASSHVGVLVLDDTERDAAQVAAAERAARATGLLRALPDAVLICAPDGTVLEVNDQAVRLFGYPPAEIVGRPVEVLVPADRAAAHRWHRDRYAGQPHARPMFTGPGIEAVCRDGSRVPVEVNLASVTLPSGPALVASVRDVTEARRTAEELRTSHELVAGVLGAATEQAIIATDLSGTIELFSPGAERLLGWRAAEVIGGPSAMFDDPSGDLTATWGLSADQPIEERITTLVGSGVAATRPWTYRTRSGEARHVSLSVTVREGPGGPTGLIIVATDETQRRQREARLAASEERFRAVFDNAPLGIGLIDAVGRGSFARVNRALATMLGYREAELLETDLLTVCHADDAEAVADHLAALVDGRRADDLVEVRLAHAEGWDLWAQVGFAVLGDHGEESELVVVMINDITDRKRAEDELSHQSLHDALTGLPNRALITESLGQALARSRRAGTGAGVLYLDLDGFKQVNDSLGHAAGDELLVEVARRLQGCMRDSDVAGRLGGDEFIVVCERVAGAGDLRAVAERISHALAIRLPLGGTMVTVSASIGIAFSPAAEGDPAELVREADLAMYRAKSNGRAQVEFADAELQAHATRQLQLETDLRAALSQTATRHGRPRADEEFVLDFQPCFAADTGQLVACEALLRWRHPTRGLLGPGQFLDVAEDRSLMVPLGAWVLRAACRQAARWWRSYGADAPEVWVNVSAAQLGKHRFASQVSDALETSGLPAGKLCLELTERQALSTGRSTFDDLHALPDLGVRLLIDDFGTGYAGLEYLRRLPVSGLKVDASYVAAIGTDPTGAALAATVMGLGRALDLTVVAEGVETIDQREAVVGLGADLLQGFLLARPGPPERVTELLAAQVAS